MFQPKCVSYQLVVSSIGKPIPVFHGLVKIPDLATAEIDMLLQKFRKEILKEPAD